MQEETRAGRKRSCDIGSVKRVPGSRISGNRYSEVVDSGE